MKQTNREFTPVAHAHGGERCEHRADVDEHVENLETRVAQFGILFVVVKLSHERLEVTFEQAVAEGDHHQGADHHGLRSNAGNHQRGIPHRHHQDTRDDRPLIVAQPVGDQAAALSLRRATVVYDIVFMPREFLSTLSLRRDTTSPAAGPL